ncbi:MAG: Unknown protein [uncultured Sulfurovum sp.]|uniref:Uncharacterized protein n=1 Tax=uncultured Sulfurovum sp. TaxID=269237 RepID=A0A6S6RS99_9BACT|nr:MAG: Unknown protein [uncultured Sulfurovum sp.]
MSHCYIWQLHLLLAKFNNKLNIIAVLQTLENPQLAFKRTYERTTIKKT